MPVILIFFQNFQTRQLFIYNFYSEGSWDSQKPHKSGWVTAKTMRS